jgi:hypothetical protein
LLQPLSATVYVMWCTKPRFGSCKITSCERWTFWNVGYTDVLYETLQAQVLPDKEAEKRLAGERMPKDQSLPVMFFGTLEVAWVAALETCSWREGTEKGYYQKGQGRKHFQVSVQQVGGPCFFCMSHWEGPGVSQARLM